MLPRWISTTAPWSAAIAAFFVAAGTAAGSVPLVMYKADDFWKAFVIVAAGIIATPFGALLGIGLRNRVTAWLSGVTGSATIC